MKNKQLTISPALADLLVSPRTPSPRLGARPLGRGPTGAPSQIFVTLLPDKAELIQRVYPSITHDYKDHQWLSTRAILAARNKDVNAINIIIQNGIPGEATTYKSVDTVINQDEAVQYPTEFLNSPNIENRCSYYSSS